MIFFLRQANWTPLHCAVHSGHVECLDLLLSYQRHSANQNISTAKMVCDVINMADKDGWTITHLAATRESKVSLDTDKIGLKYENRTEKNYWF